MQMYSCAGSRGTCYPYLCSTSDRLPLTDRNAGQMEVCNCYTIAWILDIYIVPCGSVIAPLVHSTRFQRINRNFTASIINPVMESFCLFYRVSSPPVSRSAAMCGTAENDLQCAFSTHYSLLPSTGSASKSSAIDPSPFVVARFLPSTKI